MFFEHQLSLCVGNVEFASSVGDFTFPRLQFFFDAIDLRANFRHFAFQPVQHFVEFAFFALNFRLEISFSRFQRRNVFFDILALNDDFFLLRDFLGQLLVEFLHLLLHVLQIFAKLYVFLFKLGELFRGIVEILLNFIHLRRLSFKFRFDTFQRLFVFALLGLLFLEIGLQTDAVLGHFCHHFSSFHDFQL